MNKKIYIQPLSEVVIISNCDLICESIGLYDEDAGIIGTKERIEEWDVVENIDDCW